MIKAEDNIALKSTKSVNDTATDAKAIADNTNQYFWYTSSGSDTGAHITEKTQEAFLADPANGGGNLLARSNGIAVRDGLTELASFGADGQTFNNDYGEEVFKIGKTEYQEYGGTKLNWVAYDNTAPFSMTLPWDVEGTPSFTYLDANRQKIRDLSVSPTLNDRVVTWSVELCNTLATNGVRYIYASYTAKGRFPYFTVGSDGVGDIGTYSYREGENCIASGNTSHAEGESTEASGANAHAQGYRTLASGHNSMAMGNDTVASGSQSIAGGYNTIAQGFGQTVIGKSNIAQGTPTAQYNADNAFIIGNGAPSSRSNAMAVTWAGNTTIAGTLTQSSDRRLKEHISYLDDDAVEFIDRLKPAYYLKDGLPHTGFYAQDIEEADKWNCMTGEMNGFKTLGYTELIAPLVAYCQHLEERITELEKGQSK